jgi:hypothetical protein
MTRPTLKPLVGAALALVTAATTASPDDGEPYGYGYQLMTPEERIEHRKRLRSLATPEERAAYRREHHERMEERAEAGRMRLPEEPLPRGKGMGHGPQDGRGAGWQR